MNDSPIPVISIIIPVFNSRKGLGRCLDSVLAQDIPFQWELLLVDDGSTDHSGDTCDLYAQNHLNVSVLHTQNQGASLARWLGLTKARGEFVTFVDSDDYISSDYLSTLYTMECRYGSGISACRVCLMSSGEKVPGERGISPVELLEGDALFRRFFHYEFWGLPGKLYRKQLLMDIPFPKATISEDYAVMARLFAKNPQMAYSSAPLYFYEQHPGSLSHSPISGRSFEEFDNVRGVFEFISSDLPDYRLSAVSNVVGTAVKLLWTTKGSRVYQIQRKELKTFLTEQRKEILASPNLPIKTRLLALLYSL